MGEHDTSDGPCACGAWHELCDLKEYTAWMTVRIPFQVVAVSADDAREKARTHVGMFLDANAWIDKVEVRSDATKRGCGK